MAEGCYNLAVQYHNGKGVKRNIFKAKKLYRKACNLGFKKSCNEFEKEVKYRN